jgi:large repetitive protein
MRRFRILTLVGAAAVVAAFALVPGAAALDIADGTPPNGTVGVPYSYTLHMSEGSGSYPMTWDISSGALPPGLSLSTSEDTRSGTISGTPTQAGSFRFYVQVKDKPGAGGPPSTEVLYTIDIAPGTAAPAPTPAITVTTASLPDANINQVYTAPGLTASGATVTSWALGGGTLPPGLTLGANGIITGTPTQSGTFTFTVQANGNGTSGAKELSIFVIAPLGIQTLVNKTPPETGLTAKKLVGASLTTGVKAVGGRPPYTFTATGTVPPGLKLDSATGKITGAGTTAGRYPFTVTVTDGTGAKASVEWNVTILPLLDFTKGKGLPLGRVGQLYSARVPVRGKDSATAQFAVAGQIPPGLGIDDNGRLTGMLLKAGIYRIKVYAFSESGAPVSKTFSLRVRA